MNKQSDVDERVEQSATSHSRERLLAGLPVSERRMQLAGIRTAVLEAGNGPPVLLLHGPGELAAKWLYQIPRLVAEHRVIAPDLPGHGETRGPDGSLDAKRVLAWLGALIEATCPSPPALVGHILGGAIAARFTVAHESRIDRLILVDSLGLDSFRPSFWFALTMIGFMLWPTERSYDRFMRQCSFDLDALQEKMGDRWDAFVAHSLAHARSSNAKVARQLMRTVGVPRIPPGDLAEISVPTTLIWGRHDRALKLQIATDASRRYGWPLHVIEDSADDPSLDQPEAFWKAMRRALHRRE